jgi:hypothetical protein
MSPNIRTRTEGDGVAFAMPLTTFVGPRGELDPLRSLIGGCRLVTITGPGGSGKTRLAERFVASRARAVTVPGSRTSPAR